jgi:putative membrane protein
MTQGKLLQEAVITDGAVTYKVLATCLVFASTIIGIPLLVIAWPAAAWYWHRYYQHLSVSLTTRELKVHRGILVREEKSIPLEKITDLAVYQGPVMRWLGLKGIKVETAGQSSGAAALVSIVGIDDTDAFRDRVLDQRDRITDRDTDSATLPPVAAPVDATAAAVLELATEIRDSLRRIETALERE